MISSHRTVGVPKLGVGLVWWPGLDPLCRSGEGLVHVVEFEPEAFWRPQTASRLGFKTNLPAMTAHLQQPRLLHGVGAPFGGRVAQSATHSDSLAADIAALKPHWISDHLSFNQYAADVDGAVPGAICTGFLMPPAQSHDGVVTAASHIVERQRMSGVPVAFETPVSYLPMAPGEMSDGAFAAAVAEAAECGILLDLHNILCNERNGRQTVSAFLDSIPLDHVWEVHLAGGESHRGFFLDAHSGPVEPALMNVLDDLMPRLTALGAINFEITPDHIGQIGLPAISAQLEAINRIWEKRPRSAHAQGLPAKAREPLPRGQGVAPANWEAVLGASVTGIGMPAVPGELADWARAAAPAFDLYKSIAQETRASMLVPAMPDELGALLLRHGEQGTRAILGRFWNTSPPAFTAIDEAAAFKAFLAREVVEHHAW